MRSAAHRSTGSRDLRRRSTRVSASICPAPPRRPEIRVAVRFANSGRPVSNGDVVLNEASKTGVLAAPPRSFVVPAPTDPGALFRLLCLYEADRGIYELLCRLDFRNIRRAHLEYCVFGQIGAEPRADSAWSEQVARDCLNDMLHTPRFQQDILGHVLRAFPEKRRVVFIHIPKCAGTDLLSHLALCFPLARQHWKEESWTDWGQLFLSLAEFVREVQFCDSILVGGHVRLTSYIDDGLLRPADRVFTVIRNPIEIAISSINYMISKFQVNIRTGQLEPDVKEWMSLFGLSALPREINPQVINEISHRALYTPELVPANSICYWLGGGDVEAVIARLANYHVELTSTARYHDWLEQEWGISAYTRANESTKYLRLSALSHQDLAFIRDQSSEDQKLFDLISQKLKAFDRPSITGEGLL